MASLTTDQKWVQARTHFEAAYRDNQKKPIRFQKKPSEIEIQYLFEKMIKLRNEEHDFYFHNPVLLKKRRFMEGLEEEMVDCEK